MLKGILIFGGLFLLFIVIDRVVMYDSNKRHQELVCAPQGIAPEDCPRL
jgi:hypothetical protein